MFRRWIKASTFLGVKAWLARVSAPIYWTEKGPQPEIMEYTQTKIYGLSNLELKAPITRKENITIDMSEEELIRKLGSAFTPKAVKFSRLPKPSKVNVRKLVKQPVPKSPKIRYTAKWRSVEPTSSFEDFPLPRNVLDDVRNGFHLPIPESIQLIRPDQIALDNLENIVNHLTNKRSERVALFLCLDFDTPVTPRDLLRIKQHHLEFLGHSLRQITVDYENDMPDHVYRSMVLRSIDLTAGAYAKQQIKQRHIRSFVIRRFTKMFNKWKFRVAFNHIYDRRAFPIAEPTSRITTALNGIAASIYAGYSFYKFGKNEDDDTTTRFIMNWAMQGVTVISKGAFLDWLLWILSFINIFASLPTIAADIFSLLKNLLTKYTSYGSGPEEATVGQLVEATSLTEVTAIFSDAFAGIATNVGTIATVLSVFIVITSSIMLGLNIKDVYNAESLASRFIKAGTAISKGKTGLYAILAMIGDLKPWLEQALSSLSLNGLQDTFSRSILQCDIDDTETLKKAEIFDYIEYLTNPVNSLRITQLKEDQIKLAWTHSVLSKVLETNAKKQLLGAPAVQLLTKHIAELNKVRAIVFRHVRDEETRFVPFWINIYGLAGTRKSTFMSKLAKNLVAALRKLGKYGMNGENNIYSVNFTDKYLTGYKQEEVVLIDDIFQDATPLGDRSSALDIISWVSNIPHLTNQAALEDKGLPFTSKIIISTSNVEPAALQRKEITCQEALKRRMKFAVEFQADDGEEARIDPMLGAPIKIFKLNPLAKKREATPIPDAQTLGNMILDEYLKWYDLQQTLIANGGASDECVSGMLNYVNATRNLEPTSVLSWMKGIFTTHNQLPHLVLNRQGIHQFDENHHPDMVAINRFYVTYHNQMTSLNTDPMNIVDFAQEFITARQEIEDARQQLDGASNWLTQTVEFIKTRPMWQYIGTALGLLVAYKWFTREGVIKIPEPTAIQYDYGKPIRRPPRIAKAVIPTSLTADAYKDDFTTTGVDSNAMDLVLTNLIGKGGIARIIVPLDNNSRVESAVAVRVGGTSILANHHVFAKFKEGQDFTVEIPHYINAMKPVRQKFNSRRLVQIGNSDACIYRCDNSMPPAKTLVHHFSNDDIKIKSTSAVIATRNPESMYVSNVIATPVTRPCTYTDETGVKEYSTVGCYEVSNYITTKGMSGSLLVALDSHNPRKLLGIQTSRHVHSKAGYFQPITQSMLNNALHEVGEDLSSSPVDREFVAEACSVVFDQHCPPNLGKQSLIYIGKLDKSSQVRSQDKTKLCPSLVHDESTLTKAPAVLDKYDSRLNDEAFGKDIMFKNMEGYDKADYGGVNMQILDEVTEMMAAEYSCVRSVPGISRRLLTDDEMVNGIVGRINPIDMTTSPGYPFVKQRTLTGVNGKYEWFEESIGDTGRKLYTPKSVLQDRLNLRENAARNGARVESEAYVCKKDETRPLARVENGITRLFICLPMDFNLLIRKYFGMYTATQHALAGKISSSVGLDPVTGWKGLYDRLRSKGDQWEDFDYKNWDQFLHPEFVKRYATIVNRWYGDSDDSPNGKVRHVLMQELVYTYLIVGNRMFLKTGGQCSGCAITAEINCDIHDIIMFYVFCQLAYENDISYSYSQDLLSLYRENVELALYGDDIVKSATRQITEWFNGKTIAPKMAQLGMKITPADKDSTEFIIKKPEEVTFLKRSFKPDSKYPERFVRAPLDHKTVWNIPQWIKNCDDKVGATRVNCEMALREMYMYGEANFNNARDYLNKRIEQYNLVHPGAEMRPLTLTYSKLQNDYEEGSLEICYPKGWFDPIEEPELV